MREHDDYYDEYGLPRPQVRELILVKVPCDTCLGMGILPLSRDLDVPCDVCGGTGEVEKAI